MCVTTMVERFLYAFEHGDQEKLRDTLSEDFEYAPGPGRPVHDKSDYLLMADRLQAGFPDWHFGARLESSGTRRVAGVLEVTGTHTGRLDLSHLGLGSLRPTGRSIALPRMRGSWTVDDGRITRCRLDPPLDEALHSVLAQLGVSVPAVTCPQEIRMQASLRSTSTPWAMSLLNADARPAP